MLARTSGPERQFERIYQRYAADVYRYALVVLRSPEDAEDVTQTTFMNAYRAMCGGERPEAPKNWLISIAHNVCRQRFRQQLRRPLEVGLPFELADASGDEHEPRYSVEDLQRALGHLAFNQRAALVMRELEGRSYAEIAQIMELSVSAVETLIFRARRALREQLEGTLTCADAELYLSKQLDGELGWGERGQLRAHLRQCADCSTLARKHRASRGAFKALIGTLPVPASVSSLFGGGSAAGIGAGVAVKAAAVICAGAVVSTGGYEAAKRVAPPHPAKVAAAAPTSVAARQVRSTPSAERSIVATTADGRAAQARALEHRRTNGKAHSQPLLPAAALADRHAAPALPPAIEKLAATNRDGATHAKGRALGRAKLASPGKPHRTQLVPRKTKVPKTPSVTPAKTRAHGGTSSATRGKPAKVVQLGRAHERRTTTAGTAPGEPSIVDSTSVDTVTTGEIATTTEDASSADGHGSGGHGQSTSS